MNIEFEARRFDRVVSKTALIIVSLLTLAAVFTFAAEVKKHNFKPKEGYVPDAKTAIRIAVAVWEPIYGEKQIATEKPYRAQLDNNGIWTVVGSMPERTPGGVAVIEIAKDDGKILRVSHGK